MPQDKYSALWVSHSSINDYVRCPRAYYLNNVYKDPNTNHKIQLMSPPLALGQIVHEVLESLSVIPTNKRLNHSLTEQFDQLWSKVSGEKGGFFDNETERYYQEKGRKMLRQVANNPGPIANLSIKLKQDLPYYWLSSEDNIILCGKVDWLEYLSNKDAVHIIDFKTGKKRDEESLQLPIYLLLVSNVQDRPVDKASYWYLEADERPVEQELPDEKQAYEQVLRIAKKIQLARKLDSFKCPQGKGGCSSCRPLEKIVAGEAKQVGVSQYKQDIYVFPVGKNDETGGEII